MTQWKPYLISLAVGLLVGIERENSKTQKKALGVRTFLLLGLLGCLSGGIENPWQSLLISSFAISLILISYGLQTFSKPNDIHLGLTTEMAGGIVFTAGYISHTSPVLAATLGPLVALILFSKVTLHQFTHTIKSIELKTAITILLVAAVVIDFAPDSTIDPWGFINPRKFGYLILALACLEFLSYILYKTIGEKKGSLVIGLLGGLVSSTVVLISSARQSSLDQKKWRHLAFTTIAAQVASLFELLLIIFLVSSKLMVQIALAVAPLVLLAGVSLYFLNEKTTNQNNGVDLKSPLDWKGVFRLSILFTMLLGLTSVAQHWLGKDATLALTFVTGLFELQGISLANATLYAQNQISLQLATECVLVALGASLLSKIVLTWILARNKFSICITTVFFPMLLMIAGIFNWVSDNSEQTCIKENQDIRVLHRPVKSQEATKVIKAKTTKTKTTSFPSS